MPITTIEQLCPEGEVSEEYDPQLSDKEPAQLPTPVSDPSRASSSRAERPTSSPAFASTPQSPPSDDTLDSDGEHEAAADKDLADGIRKLSINLHPYRYHGKSSGLVFIRSALDLRAEVTGPRPLQAPRPERPLVSTTPNRSLHTLC